MDDNCLADYAMADKEKYSLRPRSIARRLEVEQKLKQPVVGKRTPKPKQKPAPLSKYRRKTANARERSRMKEINQAFETLRRAIPPSHNAYHSASSPSPSSGSSSCGSSAGSEKLTKITTLRLAMDYIESLTRVLEHDAFLMADDDPFGDGGLFTSDRGSLSSLGSIGGASSTGGDLLSDDLDSFDDIPNIPSASVDDCCDDDMAFDIFLDSDHAPFPHIDTHHPTTP